MRMGGSTLLKQSISYFFMHKSPWYLIGIALVIALGFVFGVEGRFDFGLHADYWYAIPPVFFRTLWQIWLVRVVLAHIDDKKYTIFASLPSAFVTTCSAWWLIGWLVLLEWAAVPLLREPYCYSESVDLALFALVALLDVMQVVFNFFLFPALANGERSFKKVFLDACHGLVTHGTTLFVFFILLFFVALASAALIGIACSFMHTLLEFFVSYNWLNDLFKALWLYTVNYGALALLGVAQAIFYSKHHQHRVSDGNVLI